MVNLSPQQSAVVDFVTNKTGSVFVEAVAGAGKTTTLIEMLKQTKGSVAFTAYNKKIADEVNAKVAKLNLGNRVRVGTFHSFGFGAWRRIYPNVKVDEKAKAKQIENFLLTNGSDTPKQLFPFIHKIVSLAKQRALGVHGLISDRSEWYAIIDHFDLTHEIEDESLLEQGVDEAIEALRESIRLSPTIIDFDDMIYMPVQSGCRMWENDWIFVDEAQDTNPARRALARKMLRPNGRAAWVGDRHQAIYGFSGADNDAIDQIIRDFRCARMPLTVTYRCPKSVVEASRAFVSHITAAEEAPEGLVRTVEAINIAAEDLQASDAFLCRNTKPLVETAYQLIRNKIACHVEGKDIGMGLLKLANRFPAKTLSALLDKLDAYAERETQKLIAKGKETQAEALQDRIDTVKVIADNCVTVDDLRTTIVGMFQDGDDAKPTLTLSTVHKAKGREWDRVFILGFDVFMPSKYARQQWQQEQEVNIQYVAYTRAREELALVCGKGPFVTAKVMKEVT